MKINMKIKKFVFPVIIMILLIFIFNSCSGGNKNRNRTYDFTTVSRGTLEKTVTSSGSLSPVSTVSVLAQMSGKVEKIHVDFNDQITRGQILAVLNTDMLRLRREQQLAAVVKARANYELQSINYQNQVRLAERNLISDFELRTGRTTLNIHAAELSAAEASLNVIETEINQFAYITSPIDGIVLQRNINEGQNVVDGSSTNSTSLFTLAEDLREMQIEANVDELDISAITIGQSVRFTLEALPGNVYYGIVKKIHLMPTTVDNVITYKVIINADNADGTFLPGMTCQVEFIQEQRENILIVPNAALRYVPSSLSSEEIEEKEFNARVAIMPENERRAAIEARNARQTDASRSTSNQQGGLGGLVMPQISVRRAPAQPQQQTSRRSSATNIRTLWYINTEGQLEVIAVKIGISTNSHSEIITDENIEGKRIILRERI